ncbi:hypothetical protein [Ulvibacter litoralis]|uniref:HPt domain-containing protein n=1 Tax=Ulvibacter litoralis TaxID=227084 RepID=A0A1G7CK24_9FLAO|nr:hypothetical protein [Ulvibacter litoralis]GHC47054.1 histidine kinase [Ulvibacter litoralis]SDE39687.1 hypothetical protein SAMN05421855_101426 [Ulvibacter litoralis]
MIKETPNLLLVKQLADGDVSFEKKLVGVIKKELPVEIETYTNYYNSKEFVESANIVHKIKHKISILGMAQSHQFVEDYENELREENNSKHQGFLSVLEVMINFLKQY